MNKDRRRGCLLGLAIGDAIGCSIEFKPRGSFPPIATYRSGGPHGLDKGCWTDDSSMALALADSIKQVGWDLNDQARRYVQWYETGKYSVNGRCFDIGCTTRQALERWIDCKDATQSGLTEPESSGNGGIMRIAPVAIHYYDKEVSELYDLGSQASSVTHASDMCKSAAGYMTVVLAALINGQTRDEALEYNPSLSLLLHPCIDNIAKGSYRHKTIDQIKGSGFVADSLEAALWSFWCAKDFKEAVLNAVNLGDDTDTTGACTGQFAGAFWGEKNIPKEFLDGLARMDMIEQALNGLQL